MLIGERAVVRASSGKILVIGKITGILRTQYVVTSPKGAEWTVPKELVKPK